MNQERVYQICTHCVMDTSDHDIHFDDDGICNHCYSYKERQKRLIINPLERQQELTNTINLMKRQGKGKEYDCIIGVSGGVDSSYVAYLAKEWGLRGLLVHLDNGWNSELAVKNIQNIVEYTGFDLYTLVIDWDEFKDLQRSFFKADVLDLELLSDHAIFATVYRLARKYRVEYLLSGENFETEAILPLSWNWRKSDDVNIKAIHRKFGSKKLKTFPFMGTIMKTVYQYFGIAKSLPVLNYVPYNKENIMDILSEKMGWTYYGGKHYESIFTRFYQGVVLPRKFNIDKRKAHLSTLINSGQIDRDSALEILKEPPYPIELQEQDIDLVAKKLNMSHGEIESYLTRDGKSHLDYKSDQKVFDLMRKVYIALGWRKYNKYV